MIRLDGNSLAAFRGCGVAGTVQSVAGCELFGAAREPLWASPYSAAATRALKDAFTAAQWVTIRDYGFAHPALVPFINEDPMLVMSLIDGLGTRWLVGDGTAYIVTPSGNFETGDVEEAKAKFYATIMNNESAAFGIGNYPTFFFAFGWYASKMGLFNKGTGTILGNIAVQPNTVLEVEIKNEGTNSSTLKINGEYKGSFSGTGYPVNSDKSFDIFCRNKTRAMTGGIAYVERIKNGNQTAMFYPFKRNGAMGMIDLLTGTFYGNANSSGSFSESIGWTTEEDDETNTVEDNNQGGGDNNGGGEENVIG